MVYLHHILYDLVSRLYTSQDISDKALINKRIDEAVTDAGRGGLGIQFQRMVAEVSRSSIGDAQSGVAQRVTRIIEAQTYSTVESNHPRLISELDTYLRQEADFTKHLAYNLNFRRTLEGANEDTVQLTRQLNENVEPLLWYFVASDTYMKGINIYSEHVNYPLGPFLQPDDAVRDTDWYQAHRAGFTTAYRFEDGRLYAARTLLDIGTSSKMIGVLRVELFQGILSDPISSMNYMGNGAVLTDENGQIIFSSPFSNGEADKLVVALAAGEGDTEKMDRAVILWQGKL